MDDAEEPDLYWNIPASRRKEILDLMATGGVKAYFCGHLHRNGGGRYRGMEVVASGPVGFPLGDDPSGYRIIEIEGDRIHHAYKPLRVGK
jgi:predicted phosphodiesterase